ncbi:hypothetical protein [Actinocorallia longicatena]|uniref:Ricin-type beta-trefoil lectin protein n=1 Tax=Actinocorallia longicatena TaxID=111803 RepID=A0ABP6QH75_9ACTN
MTEKRRGRPQRGLCTMLMTIVLTLCGLAAASPARAADGLFIYNLSSGSCMVDPYGGQGKYAQLQPCQDTPSHLWQPQCDADPCNVVKLANLASGRCLQDVFEGLHPRFATCSASAPEQKWSLSLTTDGWYIWSTFTRRCLGRYSGPQGPEVRFTACGPDPEKRWNLQRVI